MMNYNEKAPFIDVAASVRGEALKGISDITEPVSESTSEAVKKTGYIYTLLIRNGAIGENNGIKAEELAAYAGFKNTRILREAVSFERGSSVICSSNAGYFLPEQDADGRYTDVGIAEIRRYYHTTRSRAISLFKVSKTAKQALNESLMLDSFGDRTIFDGEDIWQTGNDITGLS